MSPSDSTKATSYADPFNKIILGNPESDFALVFVHGWGCEASDFQPVLAQLSTDLKNFRLVAINLPGHGNTPSHLCPNPTIHSFATILLHICTALGLKNIILIGHSMGVRITAQAALSSLTAANGTSPNVKGLIWIDGSNYLLKTTPVSDMTSLSPEDRAAAKHAIFQQMFSPRTPENFKERALARVAGQDKQYSESLLKDMMRWDREEMEGCFGKLGEEGCKVLNLQSSEPVGMERVSMREGGRSRFMQWMEEKMWEGRRARKEDGGEGEVGLKQIAVAGSAHFPHVDRPGYVAEVIREFVEGVGVGGG